MADLDEVALVELSVPDDVAQKVLHYLRQALPQSCLRDLQCSHTFAKHYLQRGGLEEELLHSSLSPMELGEQGPCASTSSSLAGCASKKPKKEAPSDSGNCSSSDAESELPKEDESKYPEDLEEKMKG